MRIIVTGAASGIGRAAAKMLTTDALERGQKPRLVLADIAADPLADAAREVQALGGEVETIAADLSVPETSAKIVALAEKAFGGLEALISNAGIIQFAEMQDMTLEQWDLAFNINTRPTWLLAKAAYPMLKASKGSIVATTSLAAHEPTPRLGAYAPSKAALLMVIRQLANAWGPDGIRSNTVSPGTTATSIGRTPGTVIDRTGDVGKNPLGVITTAEDQAAAIAFLVSPAARFINGTDIGVDGGARTQLMTASGMAAAPAKT